MELLKAKLSPGTAHLSTSFHPSKFQLFASDSASNRPFSNRLRLIKAKSVPLGTFDKLERTQKVNELPVCYYCIMLVAHVIPTEIINSRRAHAFFGLMCVKKVDLTANPSWATTNLGHPHVRYSKPIWNFSYFQFNDRVD